MIALFAALERNLTNASLFSIGGGLKTALHGLNVPLTCVLAAMFGADEANRRLLFKCDCGEGKWLMIPVLLLI